MKKNVKLLKGKDLRSDLEDLSFWASISSGGGRMAQESSSLSVIACVDAATLG